MWDANILSVTFEPTNSSYISVYQAVDGAKTLPPTKETFSVGPSDDLASALQRKVKMYVDRLNADEAQKQAAASIDPATLAGPLSALTVIVEGKKPKPPDPIVPDPALVAFRSLVMDLRIARAVEKEGLSMPISAADLKKSFDAAFLPTKEYGLSFLAFGGF